ncbi:alpha/beta fold hydrolase [Nocardioides sp. AE5]|uniref:alpha/beta fold hydrolase n=1 Tax=Nocardioides sp. AE5 TaxID=2962573 RepID=UPI002881C99D|nr:alpha/beta fold hydrolase [Nocardioides sp. AE5]MDT0202785.1 alpha/beta hydrolase [Nocardioides sp. AE5]
MSHTTAVTLRPRTARPEPGVVDVLGLLPTIVGNELVLGTVRDTHRAWATRVHSVADKVTGGRARAPHLIHDAIANSVYGSIGIGLAAAGLALRTAGRAGVGPRLEATPQGRFVRSAINGLIGDRFEAEDSSLAIDISVRLGGRDVAVRRDALASAFPGATPRVAVFIHGLGENEDFWRLHRDEVGTTYAETLGGLGWSPVMLRVNTGRAIRENGVELAALLRELVAQWPGGVERIALVGHSMGGLIARAACAVAIDDERPWTERISDVITLGSPHAGAPAAVLAGRGSRVLAHLPETSAFGRILDQRSVGIEDLVEGLGHDVPPMPGVKYRLVSAALTSSPTHPVGRVLGDLLVQVPSAHGHSRRAPALFPDADLLHLPRTDHFGLLNHPDVHRHLARWLGEPVTPSRRPRRA